MKKVTRFFSLLLAIAMVLAMNLGTLTAYAANDLEITINNTTNGYTYEAYQIFKGTLSDSGILSNIEWGSGVDSTTKSDEGQTYSDLMTALRALNDFSSCTSAADVAEVLSGKDDDSEIAKTFAETVAKYLGTAAATDSDGSNGYSLDVSSTGAGYYLVRNTAVPAGTSSTSTGTYTSYILKVVGSVTVDPKTEAPKIVKKVDDKNDSTSDEDGTTWQDSADYDIGDSVPFSYTVNLPSNYADYDTYKLVFHDEQSDGLTFNNDVSIAVYIDGDTENTTAENIITLDSSSEYSVAQSGYEHTNCDFEITISDLKTVTNASSITSSSVIVVTYTSTLNDDAKLGSAGNPNEVYLEYSNNPYNSKETGTTPKDKVTVFTFELLINKTDSSDAALKGAGFTLYKYDASKGEYVAVGSEKSGATSFAFTGLDAGYYMIKETTTPSGYNTIDDIYFTVASKHETTSDNPQLYDEGGLTVTQTNSSWTALDAADVTAKFTVTKDSTGATITTDNGESSVSGSANITTSVANYTGAELPSTGGMGTKIFYTLGGVLVLGAGVLLIVKRRMRNA